MNTLLIEKQTGGYFKFTLNEDTANAITSIQNDLLAVGNQLHFKTGNGANIIKEQFIYPADVTIVAGGTFTFTTVAQVWDKLIDIDYFAWLGGGGGGGVDRFDDLLDTFQYTGNAGKAVVVDNSELRLVPITLYNKRLFTELEDTPSSLVPDKMVVVNPAGTALILKDQPQPPEQFLNSVGYFDYNDLITQTVPLTIVANVPKKLTNDTEGANTSTDQNPYGVSYVWDYATNQFNFSELEVGDTIDIRIHVQVTTTTSNQKVDIKAKFGIGTVSEFENTIYENVFKTSGLHEVNFVAPFYMGSNYITDYPAELYLTSDANGTVIVDGWYVRILRKNINIITVDYQVDDATTTSKGIVRLAGDLSGTANNPTVPELANKVPTSRTVGTTSPLLGGGALSSNLTLSIQQANSVDSGYLTYADWGRFDEAHRDRIVSAAVTGTTTKTLTLTQHDAGTITTSWTDDNTDAVSSVFGRTGAVVAVSGDYTTSLVTESTNKNYQTDNQKLYNDATSSIQTQLNSKQPNLSGSGIVKSTGGTISYLTDNTANWDDAYNNKITTAAVTGTTTKTLTLNQQDGGTVTASWTDKGDDLIFNSPLVNTAGTISIPSATGSVNGYLSSADWTTFNSKQGALNGTGFVKVLGTTVSYDNSTYALDSDVVHLYGNETIGGTKTFSLAPKFEINPQFKHLSSYANLTGYTLIGGITDGIIISASTAKTAHIKMTNLTGLSVFELPNTSGTFALTSNLHNSVTIGGGFNGLSIDSNQVLSLALASTSVNGALSSTDWNTFNSKQGTLNGTGFVKVSGTTVSYDNSTYALDSAVVKLIGDQTIAGVKTFSSDVKSTAFRLTGGTSPTGLYYGHTNKVVLANYTVGGGIDFETNGGVINMVLDASANLSVVGSVTAASIIKSGGTSSQYLMADGSVSTGGSGGISGTTNYIPKFTGTNTIGNSSIYEDANGVGVGTTSPRTIFSVYNNADVWHTIIGGASGELRIGGQTSSGAVIQAYTPAGAVRDIFLQRDGGKLFINASQVGINTSSIESGWKFDVAGIATMGGTAGNGRLYISCDNTTNGTTYIQARNLTVATPLYYTASKHTFDANVQIGTSTDSGYRFDVNGTGRFSGLLQVNGPSATTRSDSDGISVFNGNLDYRIGFDSVNGTKGYIRYNVDSALSSHGHIFSGGDWNGTPTDLMLIRGDGRVGIGTLTPVARLSTRGQDNTSSNYSFEAANGSGNSIFYVRNDGNSFFSGTTTIQYPDQGGARLKIVNSAGSTPSGYALVGGINGVTQDGFSIYDYTNNATRLVITSGGNLLVGTNTDAGTKVNINGNTRISGGSTILQLHCTTGTAQNWWLGQDVSGAGDGTFYLYNQTSGVQSFNMTKSNNATFAGTVTAAGGFFNSDIRLKEIVDYDYNVSDIKPITYLWKDGRDNKKHVGYSAQEVQKVMPDAVNEGTDGMLSVNYVEVLVAKIAELENRIKQLEK